MTARSFAKCALNRFRSQTLRQAYEPTVTTKWQSGDTGPRGPERPSRCSRAEDRW